MTADEKLPVDSVTPQNYAALFVTVGWLRSSLSDVIDGDVDTKHLARLLESTSTAKIAVTLGKREADLFIDYNRYLTEKQKREIGGASI